MSRVETSVYMDYADKERLEAEAAERGISFSEHVRQLIEAGEGVDGGE